MDAKLNLLEAPAIPGLAFRRFRGGADYPHMAAVIAACHAADGTDGLITVDTVANTYHHLENCDPQADMLFVEQDGQVIGYGRVWWTDQADGTRLYIPIGFLHPDWRGKGIGSSMLAAGEARLRQIAAGHPREVPKFFQLEADDTEKAKIALLEKFGYQPVRYGTNMVRDLSEPFPEAPMPPGLEIRPVKPEHWRLIHEASNEAFRDHWGARDESEAEYQLHLEDKNYRPELWMVAWDGDQIASVIHNAFNSDENEELHRKRGYTEGICTRRPWRKRGLARALLVRSMQMFKEMGMTETALGVDSQNISGAFRLYESVGYRKVNQEILYRKPME